jgi:hypothetical protein
MPLVMFVGFNNQLQNAVFGLTLLRDERLDTFQWLFRQFRVCMGGKDPVVVSTCVFIYHLCLRKPITKFNRIAEKYNWISVISKKNEHLPLLNISELLYSSVIFLLSNLNY